MKYTFEECFGSGPKYSNCVKFELDLSEEDADIIREFLKENGDCDYCYLEQDYPLLFDHINDAANEAVLSAINKNRHKKLDFDDVDWSSIGYDFYWPKDLLE